MKIKISKNGKKATITKKKYKKLPNVRKVASRKSRKV